MEVYSSTEHFYECPYCRNMLHHGVEACNICGENQKIAVMICTHPVGELSAGKSWNLYPRNYSVGTWDSDDIIVKAPGMSGELFGLKYVNGRYDVDLPLKSQMPKSDLLENKFRVGKGMLKLNYVSEINYPEYRKIAPDAFGLLPATALSMFSSETVEDVYRKAVDAVIKIIGLEKGFYFSANANMEMTLECARLATMEDMDTGLCNFSETIIQKAFQNSDISYVDSSKVRVPMSKSMVGLNLQKVLCIPVKDEHGVVHGIIYADMTRNEVLSANLSLYKPALRILAKFVLSAVRNFNSIRMEASGNPHPEDIYQSAGRF